MDEVNLMNDIFRLSNHLFTMGWMQVILEGHHFSLILTMKSSYLLITHNEFHIILNTGRLILQSSTMTFADLDD